MSIFQHSLENNIYCYCCIAAFVYFDAGCMFNLLTTVIYVNPYLCKRVYSSWRNKWDKRRV